ncbi:hypothetical protein OC845_006588 [Tilletia horrida]|nr:hypothetical protein OC845_006588 [Tilletia horrida]
MQRIQILTSVVLLALQLHVQSVFASDSEGFISAPVHHVGRSFNLGNLTARAEHPAKGHHRHHRNPGHQAHHPIPSKGASFPATIPVKQIDAPIHWTWVAEVEAGGSKLNLALDAQFTDLVVNAGAYKPSATAKKGADFKVERSSAEVAVGKQFKDHVAMSGFSLNDFDIGLADKKWYQGADGLLGFAFDWKSEVNGENEPLPVALQLAGAIKESTMGLALWRNSDKAGITLGGRDPSKFKGPIEEIWIPKGFPFWSTLGKLGGVDVVFTLDTQRRVINAPRSVAASIFKNAGLETFTDESGFLLAKFDCKSPMPIFIELGKVKVPVAPMPEWKAPDGKCIVPIAGVDADVLPNGDIMAGAAFFENLYIELSWQKGTVAYAARA